MTCRMLGLLITLMLSSSSGVSSHIEGFRQGLRDLGWVEGQQIALEYRYAENLDPLPELAADLVRLKTDLIVTWGGPATQVAKQATSTIPSVFVAVANPVGLGLVASLVRPSGNLTGMASEADPEGGPGLTAKQLEVLKDAVPTVSRVAMLFRQVGVPTREAGEQARERAALVLGLTLRHFSVQRPEGFPPRQKAASFSVDQALEQLQEGLGNK